MRSTPLFFVVLFLASLALGQIADRATIVGTVTDSSSARVPNAKLALRNEATGVTTTTSTNQEGYYTVPYLPVGTYEMTVEAPGFRTAVVGGITLAVRASVTQDVALEVGAVSEQVKVVARAELLNQVTSEVSTQMDNRLYSSLPLSLSLGGRRDPEAFMQLVPGAQGQRINGGAQWAKEIEAGGSPVASAELQGDNRNMTLGTSAEAIEEFRIATGNSTADIGHGQGVLSFTFKSGTNNVHGSAYHYLRNNEFDARGFINAYPTVNRINNYGVTLGGPVYVPKVYNGRNRTFFFFNFDGFVSRNQPAAGFITIPSAAEVAGNFAGRNIIYDPLTTRPDGRGGNIRDPFQGNVIPASMFSSVSKKILQYVPGATTGAVVNNYTPTRQPTKNSSNNYTVKLDHNLTPRQQLSFSLNYGSIDQENAHGNPTGVPGPMSSDRNFFLASTMIRLSHDYSIAPTVINHFSYGFNRFPQQTNSVTFGTDWPSQLGLKGVPIPDFPNINFATDSYAVWHRTAETGVFFVKPNSSVATDQLTWIKGKHNLKFGSDFRRLQNNFGFQSDYSFTFNRLETGQPGVANTGDAFASFLLGAADTSALNIRAFGVTGDRWAYMAFYVADDFRVTPRLTLNLGLRWDLPYGHTEVNNKLSSFDPNLQNPGAGGRLGALAFASPSRPRFSNLDRKEFGPHVGLAYAIQNHTVVRAGYGISYIAGGDLGGNAQRGVATGWSASATANTQNTGVTPGLYWDDGFPQNFKYPPLIDPSFANNGGISWITADGGRAPYYQQWNVTVERTFGSNLLLSTAYVGGKGTRLVSGIVTPNQVDPKYLSLGALLSASITSPAAIAAGIPLPYPGFTGSVAQALRPYPQYSGVSCSTPMVGSSTYHSLQIKAEKRLSYGIQFLASHTWSKSLENAVSTLSGVSARDTYNRGVEKSISDGIAPHRFVASLSYDLPFGKGKRFLTSGIARYVFGDFNVAGIFTYQTGTPLGISVSNTLPLFNGANYANRVIGQDPRSNVSLSNFNVFGTSDTYINAAAFSVPAQLTFGNSARAIDNLRSTAAYNENLTLNKAIKFKEKVTLQLRGEAYNLLNRVRLGGISTNLSNLASFGTVSSQANGARTMQVSAKIQF